MISGGFNLLLINSDVEHIFMSVGHLDVPFVEMSIQIHCPFLNKIVCGGKGVVLF